MYMRGRFGLGGRLTVILMEELARLMREGRLAHGYVVVGDPVGAGREFAVDLVVQLFQITTGHPEGQLRHRIEGHMHPDVLWVEPRGKLRQIKVDDVDEALKRVHGKSYEGGWKVQIFLGADRLNPSAGNKLLKSLEEPPPKTLLLLVSGAPEQLLSTLRSRCQLLMLPRSGSVANLWKEDLISFLEEGPPRSLPARLLRAARFRAFLDVAVQKQLEAEADDLSGEEERIDADELSARESAMRRRLQRDILAEVEAWYRDLLALKAGAGDATLRFPEHIAVLQKQSEGLPMKSLFKLLENCRNAAFRLEGNTPVQVVLEENVF